VNETVRTGRSDQSLWCALSLGSAGPGWPHQRWSQWVNVWTSPSGRRLVRPFRQYRGELWARV